MLRRRRHGWGLECHSLLVDNNKLLDIMAAMLSNDCVVEKTAHPSSIKWILTRLGGSRRYPQVRRGNESTAFANMTTLCAKRFGAAASAERKQGELVTAISPN